MVLGEHAVEKVSQRTGGWNRAWRAGREAKRKGEGGKRPRFSTLAETRDLGLFWPQTLCTWSSQRRPWCSLRGQYTYGANPQLSREAGDKTLAQKPGPQVSAGTQPPWEKRRGEKTQQEALPLRRWRSASSRENSESDTADIPLLHI